MSYTSLLQYTLQSSLSLPWSALLTSPAGPTDTFARDVVTSLAVERVAVTAVGAPDTELVLLANLLTVLALEACRTDTLARH